MRKRYFWAGAIVLAGAVLAAGAYLHGHTVAVLQPRGTIGRRERSLMIYAALLSLIVIVPVYAMTFMIAVKYRAGNKKRGAYRPDFDHHAGIEFLWWAIPCLIIGVLAVVTWRSSHELDPWQPLAANGAAPLTVQVVSLDWKWLFIYPQQNIASVNTLHVPIGTPIDFELTSDSVMNSFWVPQLGGQIYTMPGMSTQLHLSASQPGNYNGASANISGQGFAGMTFTVTAENNADFATWVASAKRSPQALSASAYAALARPSQNVPPRLYRSPAPGLYNDIVMKYMMPTPGSPSTPPVRSGTGAQSMPAMSGMAM